MMRIGHGYDVHAFGEGDHVMLGGVRIANDRGLVAHSDGDVALHALCDALLGAAGLGDIGRHFPDTDQAFSGADSRKLLRAVVEQLAAAGWSVGNVDLTRDRPDASLGPTYRRDAAFIAEDLRVATIRSTLKPLPRSGWGLWVARKALPVMPLR
ncbi:MAG: 2-C-methyl-D-erythritol 2,4-cyclodiphosphate synthase [Cellvibrionales bacterium]|nr:MAG: 2-C-methyl-D-erythritol 2,4-cyclodiphosphate synthase [Cellvibrionales bacterium]